MSIRRPALAPSLAEDSDGRRFAHKSRVGTTAWSHLPKDARPPPVQQSNIGCRHQTSTSNVDIQCRWYPRSHSGQRRTREYLHLRYLSSMTLLASDPTPSSPREQFAHRLWGAPADRRERVPSGLSWQMRHPSLTITVLSVRCQMSDVLSVSREGSLMGSLKECDR